MPDWPQNWREEALRKLANSKLSPDEREEISRELAGYLEDLCSDAHSRGLNDSAAGQIEAIQNAAIQSAATQRAAAELHEDKCLGANLYRARKENPMYLNDRTKRFWLPGLTMLLASIALLAIFQFALNAYFPAVRGFQQWMIYRNACLQIYFVWVFILPFLGAGAANWSRRAGGNRFVQSAAGLFPLTLFFYIFLVGAGGYAAVPRLGEAFTSIPAHIFLPGTVTGLLLSWVVIPGLAMLLGVLPFLRASGGPQENAAPAASGRG